MWDVLSLGLPRSRQSHLWHQTPQPTVFLILLFWLYLRALTQEVPLNSQLSMWPPGLRDFCVPSLSLPGIPLQKKET